MTLEQGVDPSYFTVRVQGINRGKPGWVLGTTSIDFLGPPIYLIVRFLNG